MLRYIVDNVNTVAVFLDNKRVGSIKHLAGDQWQYVPKGQREGGEIFSTLQQCQNSLED